MERSKQKEPVVIVLGLVSALYYQFLISNFHFPNLYFAISNFQGFGVTFPPSCG